MENVKNRAHEIVERLSDEQKLAQVIGMFGGSGTQIPPEILYRFPNGLGEVSFIPGTDSKEENAQRAKKENEIMKQQGQLPVIRHNEALTGQMTADSTVFPSAIGLGATFDPSKVQQMADRIRRQMVAEGTRHALSPVMDVARDPRWGRVGETYGEDPTLCAAMSVAFTKGLQSENLEEGVMATGKHFLGYSMSEGGLNMAANPIPYRELREVYAKPFQAAITEGKLASVMNSYGSIDGDLIIASKEILTKLLREEMGFEGLVVSDYMSINKMVDLKQSKSPEKAGLEALKAGLDLELPMPYGFTDKMLALLKEDKDGQDALNRAAEHVVAAKIQLGLLENDQPKEDWMEEAYDRKVTEPLSHRLAQESIVLLKNEGLLPLQKDIKKIAVIGPHGDSVRLLFGCYTFPAAFDRDISGSMSDMPGMQANARQGENNPYQMSYFEGSTIRQTSSYVEEYLKEHYKGKTATILESIQKMFPECEVRYAKGCDVAGTDRSGFEEAIALAEWADIVIVTAGGKYGWGTSCTTGEGVDCAKIGLTGVQKELVLQIVKANAKAVLVHMDSKPLCDEEIAEAYPAILENWFPGDTGGMALAEVLSGLYNPAGRLPMTAARNEGQIPIYSSQRRGSGYHPGEGMTIAKYAEDEKTPLFAFGHGLSYTKFAYSDLKVTDEVSSDGEVDVTMKIKNVGNCDGEEVLQLYVTDESASMIRPMQELAGFYRVALKKGEKKQIRFKMRADQFAFLDKTYQWIVEAGVMQVKVGASSEDIRQTAAFTITDTAVIDPKHRGFYATAEER